MQKFSGSKRGQVRTQTPWPANHPADVIAQMEPPGQRQELQGPGMNIPTNVGLVPGSSSGRVTANPHLGPDQGRGMLKMGYQVHVQRDLGPLGVSPTTPVQTPIQACA